MSTNKHFLIRTAVILLFMAGISFKMSAQLVVLTPAGPGQNSFMQGAFLEVGVSSCGTYGTEGSATPPAGFHPRGSTPSGIGFVADVGRDGWTTGSPDYCGDYFLPGSPVEGWGVQVGATSYINDSRCGTRNITGSIVSGTVIGTDLITVWDGNITTGTAAGLHITQSTTFPNGALYFVTKVDMTNTSSAPMIDVYYGRNVDPDNDEPLSGGSFSTVNTTVSQPSASNCDALVTARGTVYTNCFLGMGARSQNAHVTQGSFSTTAPISQFYTGGGGRDTTSGRVTTADAAISVGFYWPRINPGQTVTAAFAYVLDPADLAVALEATGGAFIFSDSADITPTLADTICPNDPVQLVIASDTSYRWSWSPNIHISDTTGPIVVVTPDTSTTYTAIGRNGPCGTIIRSIRIWVDTNVRVNAGPDDTICVGGVATLRASNASYFRWYPNIALSDTFSSAINASPTSFQRYYCATNCGLDSVDVFVAPNYNISLIRDTTLCFGDSIQLVTSISPAVGTYTYTWSPSSSLVSTGIASPWTRHIDSATTFRLHVRSFAGCERDTSLRISVRGYRPTVTVTGDTTPVCYGDTVAMFASARAGICTNYSLASIPFAPVGGSGTGTRLTLSDDQLSAAIPLGFNFNFFCNTYSNIYLSSNGFATFSALAGSGCCSGQVLPNNFQPNDVIAASWTDLNPALGGSVTYQTLGTSPNRRFVIDYNGVSGFGGTGSVTSEIILYETSGVIEIHTTSNTAATSRITTMGIENVNGSVAYPVSGRNGSIWSSVVTNDARRWSPYAGSLTYSWTPATGIIPRTDSSVASAIVTIPVRTYTVAVSDSGCIGRGVFSVHMDTSLLIRSLSPDTVLCTPAPVHIDAVVAYDSIPDTSRYCDRYTVASIPYALMAGSGTAVRLGDDQLSGNLPIGFNFNFFCNNYSQFKISSNGFITFDLASTSSGCCSGQTLPNPLTPNNLIAAGWDDLNPSTIGSINYLTLGAAPNRILEVNYVGVALFGGSAPALRTQILLYEGTNIIEVHTQYANGLTPATCGIENATGTSGLAAPGRNGVAWPASVSNEAWRFSPQLFVTPGRTLSFDWKPTTGLNDSTTLHPIATVNNNTTYVLHVSDGYCDRWDTTRIVVDRNTFTGSNDTAICWGNSVNLNLTGTSRITTANWSPARWLNDRTLVNPVSRPDSNITYTVLFRDTLNCPFRDTVNITVHPILAINLSPDTTFKCFGDSQLYDATNGYFRSYAWSNGAGTSRITVGTAGHYFVVATDSFGCISHSDTVGLGIVAIPVVNFIVPQDSFCTGDSLTIGITTPPAPTTVNWNTGSSATSIVVNTAGTYSVTLNDRGCIQSDSVDIYEKFSPVLNNLPDTFICCPNSYTFNPGGGPGATYMWTSGSSDSVLTTNATGSYTVTVTAANGCSSTESGSLTRYCISPTASATPDSIFRGNTTQLNSAGSYPFPYHYMWVPGSSLTDPMISNPLASPTDNTLYTVYLTDSAHGCIDSASINVYVRIPGFFIFPDAFTPNGDGVNDRFYPVLTPGAEILTLQIYNRWGDLVYNSAVAPGWDGNFLGTEQPTGTYVYYATMRYPDSVDPAITHTTSYNGVVTLIR